ncbi:hypothetical protein F5883DRAFT_592911, partial [Diaporthe sp. PMI_573]
TSFARPPSAITTEVRLATSHIGRYIAAAQPTGSIKTNQQYRVAAGLPQRYDKQSREGCIDYKQTS